RERTGDLPLLSTAILERLARAMHRSVPQLSEGALKALETYGFPGNVRELENILERALALADGDIIQADDLQLPRQEARHGQPAAAAQQGADPARITPYDTASTALPSYIEEIEREAIKQALQENRYNKTKPAAALGITSRALRYNLKTLGIDWAAAALSAAAPEQEERDRQHHRRRYQVGDAE